VFINIEKLMTRPGMGNVLDKKANKNDRQNFLPKKKRGN
jgi:hypothetical protein